MTSPGNISLNTGGDNWRSFSFKRPILSHRRFSAKDDDLSLENEDRMNDVRRIGKGLEAMRAAYRLSCRKRPGKGRHEFGASMDDARFRRRWSVAWSPSDHKVDNDFKGFVTPLMTVETR